MDQKGSGMEAVIIATNRVNDFLRWLDQWQARFLEERVSVYSMVDTHDEADTNRIRIASINGQAFDHSDAKGTLRSSSWIIPERTCACKSLAVYRAWKDGAERIYCLDDDCYPLEVENWVKEHRTRLTSAVHNRVWPTAIKPRPRGIPYMDMSPVGLNHGLWAGHADVDATTHLLYGDTMGDSPNTTIIPHGALFPFCGMNWGCRREVAPLMYFGLHGPSWGVDRFDDIWCGWLMKKCLDHLGYAVTSGMPFIRHIRASDPFVNIEKEAPGYRMNCDLWRFAMDLRVWGKTAPECILSVSEQMSRWAENQAKREYWKKYAEALSVWASLFKEE